MTAPRQDPDILLGSTRVDARERTLFAVADGTAITVGDDGDMSRALSWQDEGDSFRVPASIEN
ncbi:hypothetical protein BO218_15500 [Microbacterium paludicola]|nr:hypothetical protein BO218_15500 [Microbacterium paludicola]